MTDPSARRIHARIKLVPNTDPNADGRWVELSLDVGAAGQLRRHRWNETTKLLSKWGFVPRGEHVVKVEFDK